MDKKLALPVFVVTVLACIAAYLALIPESIRVCVFRNCASTPVSENTSTPSSPLVTASLTVAPSATHLPRPQATPTLGPTPQPTNTSEIVSTSTSERATHKNICDGQIQTSRDAIQAYAAPNGATVRLVEPGAIVVVVNKLETDQTGKWYLVNDEAGHFLGWVQAVYVSSLSPTCPKY